MAAADSSRETLLPSLELVVNSPAHPPVRGINWGTTTPKCALPSPAEDRQPKSPRGQHRVTPQTMTCRWLGSPGHPQGQRGTNSRFDDLAQVISVSHLGRLVIIFLVSQRHAAKRHRRAQCWWSRERQ